MSMKRLLDISLFKTTNMATKVKESNMCLRKIAKPVISTDVMGNRNVEIRAVGAWVQPASSNPSEGVIAAIEEEARIKEMQQEKEARLQRFKEDVKKRVAALEKARKRQLVENNYKAAEHENNVVCQSTLVTECSRYHKNIDIVRKSSAHSIKQKPHSRESQTEVSNRNKALNDQTNQVHKFTSQARKKLGAKQVVTDDFLNDELPGGLWKMSKTVDHIQLKNNEENDMSNMDSIKNNAEKLKDKIVIPFGEDDSEAELERARLKMVHFDLEPSHPESRQERITRKTATTISGTEVVRSIPHVSVPNIYMGVQSEEEKRQKRLEHATYRRLFMDIEREQVKENLRRKEHRKRIQRLKHEKEEQRKNEEQFSRNLLEPRDPMTGDTSLEALAREAEAHQRMRETLRQNEIRLQKIREMERYLEALRAQLKEKITKKGLELPPLCCCGNTVWDTNPETCANNCIFYRNHKGYAKALQSLLISCDID